LNEIDELSRIIGNLEAKIEALVLMQDIILKKLDKMERYILSHKIMTAGIAGSVTMAGTFLTYIIRHYLGGK